MSIAVTASFEHVACPCGSPQPANRTITARDEGSGEMFTYLVCPVCSLERLSPRPRADRIGAYYPTNYAPHAHIAPQGWADRVKRLVYEVFWASDAEIRPSLLPVRPLLRLLFAPIRYRCVLAFKPPADRRIFEFGAARATDLMTFKAAGWRVEGCEPSERACAVARANGIALQNVPAEEAVLDAGVYTCILLNNVFEHIHDPLGVLWKCHDALRQGGVLMLIVPNHRSLTGRMFGAAWPGYDAPRHVWGWTPESIRQRLAAAGFAVDYIHQQATGAWLWRSVLDMRHAPGTPGRIRRWLSRHAALLGLPFSIAGAALGHGDFMRVVARKL